MLSKARLVTVLTAIVAIPMALTAAHWTPTNDGQVCGHCGKEKETPGFPFANGCPKCRRTICGACKVRVSSGNSCPNC